MSRIGKKPIAFPKNVKISQNGNIVKVEGPKGTLSSKLPDGIAMTMEENQLIIERKSDDRLARSYHGLARTLVNNMVIGVSKGFEKKLNLVGVGYRAQAQGDTLNLTLGFSHPVAHPMPAGVKVETPTQTEILLKGVDKQKVGQVAAEIRAYRSPEPYKGKGVRYADEVVVLKETKKK